MIAATLIGSGWDAAPWDVRPVGPDAPLPQHLAQWVDGSACHPALAAANLQTLQGSAVLEALAGDRLAQLGGHATQYVTREASRLLAPLDEREREILKLRFGLDRGEPGRERGLLSRQRRGPHRHGHQGGPDHHVRGVDEPALHDQSHRAGGDCFQRIAGSLPGGVGPAACRSAFWPDSSRQSKA